ncbi:hypothetical protein [Actinomadura chokoriensis]|uniref:Uncharacterized protein n=1 Tax=Actinomadura chokoriensis TaxID=454156 RepID=A0ABV4R3E0_9ACTN
MGEVRALAVRAERHLLRWRTRRGDETATRYLDELAAALAPQGWRFVKFYRREEFPVPVPLLWVHARATKDVGIVVSVLAVPGRAWAYHDAQRGAARLPVPLRGRRDGRRSDRPTPQTPPLSGHLVIASCAHAARRRFLAGGAL